MRPRVDYDVQLMCEDMAAKGWRPTNLAAAARVSDMTASRFLKQQVQTPPVAKVFADALGHPVERYIVRRRRRVA